jgi:hypothetical protein
VAAGAFAAVGTPLAAPRAAAAAVPIQSPARITIRGVYGGYLREILQRGQTPADYGINAVWVGSGSLNAMAVEQMRSLGLQVFAEFNSMHAAQYLKAHPDAAPIGPDGKPSPAPQGWQGVSAFHAGYRRDRMTEFRRVLAMFDIDGIWLDYHHAHASWERAEPELPDTDFSPEALRAFSQTTGIALPADVTAAARLLLGPHREAWTTFRCDVFTDWVREYRAVRDEVRPRALLGTFHCPWSPEDYDGAIRHKLAIDLPAQARDLDVMSPMPYHARFGHAADPAWISRQVTALGELLTLTGEDGERPRIWPIVQLADWGERVPVDQVAAVIDHGTRRPATGVMVFNWSGLAKEWDKVEALGRAFRA